MRLILVSWLALVAVGFALLLRHSSTPGRDATATTAAGTPVTARDGQWHALLLLHPECPCSLASLAELERLMARLGDRLSVEVLFVDPDGMPFPTSSASWKRARSIARLRVERDAEATLARRYGAWTSGQLILVAPDGRVAFTGGITSERGHEGDNMGSEAIASLVTGHSQAPTKTPVFGCPLFGRR